MARRKHELAPVVGERVVEREPRTSYAWQPTDSLLHVAIERGELWAGVVRGRSVEIDEDAPANLEPEVLAFEVRQAASQQGRPRDEDDRERGLQDEKRRARQRRLIGGGSIRAAERVDGIGAGRDPRGQRAEREASHERKAEGKAKHQWRRPGVDRQKCRPRE